MNVGGYGTWKSPLTAARGFWVRHKMPAGAVRWLDAALVDGRIRDGRALVAGALVAGAEDRDDPLRLRSPQADRPLSREEHRVLGQQIGVIQVHRRVEGVAGGIVVHHLKVVADGTGLQILPGQIQRQLRLAPAVTEGEATISVAQIIGTVARARDFDGCFQPIHAALRKRIDETDKSDLVTQDLLIEITKNFEQAHWMWQAQQA